MGSAKVEAISSWVTALQGRHRSQSAYPNPKNHRLDEIENPQL